MGLAARKRSSAWQSANRSREMLINGWSAGLHHPASPQGRRLGRGHVMTLIQSDAGYCSAAGGNRAEI
jgi:hypothetical protein